ncbi:MAG: glycosyltransferase [Paracoccaceae bacterium]
MMRIAVVSHVRHPIAPPFQGGMEAHSWHLVDALAKAGHDVTLFASGDSADALPRGVRLHPVLEEHYDRAFPWADHHGSRALNEHVDAGFARAAGALIDGGFDVIHNNSLHRYPPRLAVAQGLATVTSLHVPPFDALRRAVEESAAPWARFTVTSARQKRVWWPEGAPEAASVAWNGIDPDLWPYAPGGDGSAVWAGRIAPNKGTHLAVAAARGAGVPLTVCGTIEDRGYFDATVRPYLGRCVTYAGHLSGADVAAVYAQASVLLFTPLWEEPFGLAAIEAMATGLPVAAIDNGAVREVIGDAGTFAPHGDLGALADALTAARRIPPARARARVLAHFTLERMIARYARTYRAAMAGLPHGHVPVTFPAIELSIERPAPQAA